MRVLGLIARAIVAFQQPQAIDIGPEPAFHLADVVDSLVSRGRLISTDTSVSCYDGAVRIDITVHRDSSGLVRRLVVDAGSGDSSDRTSYYYDGAGRLRTAYALRGAVNGTRADERVAYDANGTVHRRDQRVLTGPGYPFAAIRPIRSPRAWLTNACH